MPVEFHNNSVRCIEALDDACLQFLDEAGSELASQTQRRQTRVDTGQTKGAWTHVVDSGEKVCTVGNTLENSIWEEFGTGEFALAGNGRKGGWWYKDRDTGEWRFTMGKTPLRPLHGAFTACKAMIIKRAEQVLKGRMG